jgi:hypothetical protein
VPLVCYTVGMDEQTGDTASQPAGVPWLGDAWAPADFDTDAASRMVQPDLFGAALPGPGELRGQGSLLEDGQA